MSGIHVSMLAAQLAPRRGSEGRARPAQAPEDCPPKPTNWPCHVLDTAESGQRSHVRSSRVASAADCAECAKLVNTVERSFGPSWRPFLAGQQRQRMIGQRNQRAGTLLQKFGHFTRPFQRLRRSYSGSSATHQDALLFLFAEAKDNQGSDGH